VDAGQFGALYEQHRAPIFSFLLRMTRDQALARDLSQETWMRLAASAHTLRADTDYRAWLFTARATSTTAITAGACCRARDSKSTACCRRDPTRPRWSSRARKRRRHDWSMRSPACPRGIARFSC
jgi:hypothetical protein